MAEEQRKYKFLYDLTMIIQHKQLISILYTQQNKWRILPPISSLYNPGLTQ